MCCSPWDLKELGRTEQLNSGNKHIPSAPVDVNAVNICSSLSRAEDMS